MKKHSVSLCIFMLLCFVILAGCAGKQPTATTVETKAIYSFDQISEDLNRIVENNSFDGVVAFDNRLLKTEVLEENEAARTMTHRIQMMDLLGNDLAAYTCTFDDAYDVTTLTATQDGGFLFVLGFSDYAYSLNIWASDNGYASRIIKCDRAGNVQFDTPLDGVEGYAIEYCYEANGQFYFFGTIQTPETKTTGTYGATDIYMLVLGSTGFVVNTQVIAGSDFDFLSTAKKAEDNFVLSIMAQSSDGDFVGSQSNGYPECWVFTVNYDLEITNKEIQDTLEFALPVGYRLGERNGMPVYKDDPLLADFDAGTPEIFIDYGNFYLIMSSNTTGVYEKMPLALNGLWYYTENVYSAYDYSGNLLFRSSVDTSPDYDARLQEFYSSN